MFVDNAVGQLWLHNKDWPRKTKASWEFGKKLLIVQRQWKLPGGCYVDTANLDGESNLKLKESVKCTQHQLRYATNDQPLLDQAVANLTSLRGQVVAEAPQKSIHSFKGRVEMDQQQEALDAKHLLLRGTVLKNTSWIMGLVVYTGPETRMVMNSRAAKAKYPNIEKVINRSMLVVVGAQCVMALISDILYLVNKERFLSLWYLFPSGQKQSILLPEFIGYWLTFFVSLDRNIFAVAVKQQDDEFGVGKQHEERKQLVDFETFSLPSLGFSHLTTNIFPFSHFETFFLAGPLAGRMHKLTGNKHIYIFQMAWSTTSHFWVRLYSNLMPISLYFTMEVCNAAQAVLDVSMLLLYDVSIFHPC